MEVTTRLSPPYALLLLQQANRGQGAARNKGVRHARSGFCVFLDCDMIPAPDLLEEYLRAYEYHPEDIIMGNVNPVLYQNGTPRQVYDLCRLCIEKGKKIQGGFILAPGCGLPPRAPPHNVWMMTKAVNDFGWYE